MFILVVTQRPAYAETLNLSVQLRNDATVDPDTIAAAQTVVSEIYVLAGVRIVWCDASAALTIILRPRASAGTARRAADALGYTPGEGEERGRLAFVLMDRVNLVAKGYGSPQSVVLGATIAHELRHLRSPGH